MKHLPTLLMLFLLLHANSSSGDLRDSKSIVLKLPKGIYADRKMLLAGTFDPVMRQVSVAPLREVESNSRSPFTVEMIFNNNEITSRSLFCFPVNPSLPFGAIQRMMGKSAKGGTLDLPQTYFAGRWAVPDSLIKKSLMDIDTSALTILRIVNDNKIGTIYHPYFFAYVPFQHAKLRKSAHVYTVYIPFLESGTYEFAIVDGRDMRQVLRRRVRLTRDAGTLFRILENDTMSGMMANAEKQPMESFAERDIVEDGIVRLKFNIGERQ